MIQKVVDEQRRETPWWGEANDRAGWREFELRFILHALRLPAVPDQPLAPGRFLMTDDIPA